MIELDLSRTAITELPQPILQLTVLKLLYLTGCCNITNFPEISANTKNLYLALNAIEVVPPCIQFLLDLLR